MQTFASPTITLNDWQSGAKSDIDLVEDQLRGWLFEPAHQLASNHQAGPAILTIVTPYFEAVACYLRGTSSRGRESEFLRFGLSQAVAGASAEAIDNYVTQVRNGLLHEAIFRRVVLHHAAGQLPKFGLACDQLCVDPWWLLQKADEHFAGYFVQLRRGETHVLEPFNAFMQLRKTAGA